MKAIIIGAGEVGYQLTEHLSRAGHDVAVVDIDVDRVRIMKEKANALVVHGSGVSGSTLEEAGAPEADLLVAVTDHDEVNIVSCLHAREFGIARKIARVRNLDYMKEDARLSARNLGIDMLINPESVVAEEIFGIASHSGTTEVAQFADGNVLFIGMQIDDDSPIAGVSLMDLGEIRGVYRLVVTAITRGKSTIIPRGEDVIQVGDTIYFICNKVDLSAINYLLDHKIVGIKNAFILGGGRVGFDLARHLIDIKCHVKLIEKDQDRCVDLADRLDDVLVLNTHGSDVDTLKNEGIGDADVYIAVTENDNSNILFSLLAKQYGVKRAVALVNQPALLSLAPSLGVDAVVCPRMATASAILKYVRKGDVLNITMLEQCNAEVMEAVVPGHLAELDKPLKNLRFPKGAIIGAIARGSEILIPTGDDHLTEGDHVVVFSLPSAVPQVETFFS